MKFRKKPVVIEAMQFDTYLKTVSAIVGWGEENGVKFEAKWDGEKFGHIIIPTKEGDMTASPGDWIIKGVAGEFYPCKPEIFESTYEAVLE